MPEDLRAAIEAATQQEDVQALLPAFDGTADEAEATDEGESAPPAAPQQGEDPADVVTEGGESAEAEAPQGTADVPDSYFGVDLSDVPVEKRASIISTLQEQNERIRSAMQRNAELTKALEAGETPQSQEQQQQDPAPADLTDEDILAAFGLSKDDPMYEVKAEVLLPVAKRQLQTDSVVERLVAEREAEQALAFWDQQLDALEAEFGQVPADVGGRDTVIEYALEHNVLDPAAAFHAVTAGARKVLSDAATKARQEALAELKRTQAGNPRPQNQATEPVERVKAATIEEAMRQAADIAERQTGTSFDQFSRG
jgi:hypothetical protein